MAKTSKLVVEITQPIQRTLNFENYHFEPLTKPTRLEITLAWLKWKLFNTKSPFWGVLQVPGDLMKGFGQDVIFNATLTTKNENDTVTITHLKRCTLDLIRGNWFIYNCLVTNMEVKQSL